MRLRFPEVVLLACVGGCSSPVEPMANADLAKSVVARIGSQRIDRATVERISKQQAVAPAVALRAAIFDALLAEEFKVTGDPARAATLARVALARTLLQQFDSEARQQGPITDDELAAATARHWWQMARPDGVRTTHAVVLAKKPVEDAKARALAERIAAAVRGIRDVAAFRKAAKSVKAKGLKVKVEDLPVIVPDGRGGDPLRPPKPGQPPQSFDQTYAEAANALVEIGDQSDVVRTAFGYHVILLTERVEGVMLSAQERREKLRKEILAERARRLRDEALKKASEAAAVRGIERERDADSLTQLVRVQP